MAIETDEDLERVFKETTKKVIEKISERTIKLLREHINMETYGINKTNTGKPKINESYLDGTGIPSYEFRDKAWNIKLEDYMFDLFYDSGLLSAPSSSSPYLHGNYNKGIDRREQLAEILNVSGVAGDSDMKDSKVRQPYWDNFIDEFASKLGGWMYTEYNNLGLSIPSLKTMKLL